MASAPEPRLYRVAPSFATAMIIAGHALDSVNNPAFDGPHGLDRFLASLDDFGLDDEQLNSWRYLVDMSGLWEGG